jgi:hypothetical protein
MKVIYFLANPQSNGVLENVKREERCEIEMQFRPL